MKPLKDIYKIFEVLSICPPLNQINRWIKMLYIFNTLFCLIILFCTAIAMAVYLMRNFFNDLANTIVAAYQFVAAANGIYFFIVAFVKRHDLKENFDDFQTFYDASK